MLHKKHASFFLHFPLLNFNAQKTFFFQKNEFFLFYVSKSYLAFVKQIKNINFFLLNYTTNLFHVFQFFWCLIFYFLFLEKCKLFFDLFKQSLLRKIFFLKKLPLKSINLNLKNKKMYISNMATYCLF